MEEHLMIKNMLLSKRMYLIVIILITLVAFYWLLIRPYQIKSKCLKETNLKAYLYGAWATNHGNSKLQVIYETCLNRGGI